MNYIPSLSCDVLIVGSGAAGLSLALRIAPCFNIIILCKEAVNESSTFYAQGGIASIFHETDSISSYVEDTINNGAGIVDNDTAEFVASNARHCVQWLIDLGVRFNTKIRNDGIKVYHLTREAGHSNRRILHTADATGKEIEKTLVYNVIKHKNIQIFKRFAIDLIISDHVGLEGPKRVIGAWVWNQNKKQIEIYQSKVVVLATGGASKVYRYTTNPDTASGDGIAIAWRAGCRVANLEFNQFHPTSLFHPKARNFLLTEALRGEGAVLKRPDGSRFMQDFDERAELAPRDIVVRAIDHEMKRLDVNCMYLDISHKPAIFILQHFPTIYKKLLKIKIDLTKESVPIVPAAHYTCGGVIVDLHGKTDIEGLYAIGEVSYTGLHGANRMASNSLLECLVYSWSAAKSINEYIPYVQYTKKLHLWDQCKAEENLDEWLIIQNRRELRFFMWNDVGIVRTTKRLSYALRRIKLLQKKIDYYYNHFPKSNTLLELRNLVQVAELIVHCALMRKESRGLHYTLDYPKMLIQSGPSVLTPTPVNS